MSITQEETRHAQVYRQLVKRLALASPGSEFPTVAELKEEFDASQATITQAVRRLQQQGFIRRPVGKKRYVIAQQAPRTHTTIAVLRPFWPSPEYDSLLTGLQQACTQRRWILELIHYQAWSDLDLTRIINEHQGIISIGHPSAFADGQEDHLLKQRYPFISLMNRPENAAFAGVEGDDVALGRMAVATLRKLGHRRIAVFLNEPHGLSVERRLRGWRTAMQKAGEGNLDELVIDCSVESGQDSIEIGRERFERWLGGKHAPFTAVFATAWTGALAVMRVMHDRHIDIPADCSLLAQGGLWPVGRYLVPPLSTIDYDANEWGRAACELLAEQIAENPSAPRSINLAPEIHLRGTTAHLRA
ncbi:MAG: substrate-binding domain-containing protein [Opitutaceae bacterium]|jgi:DNA-binding LacI/PurR family transcriptional regulator|nr:substrate-binding domain-containing protein [Opitutaceae bacterium]